MAIQDLSQADFKFYQEYAKKMHDTHEKEFMEEIDPDLIRALYRGKKHRNDRNGFLYQHEKAEDILLTMSLIFPAANTILPNLYHQNPKPIVMPEQDATHDSAALMSACIKHYMKVNKAKIENQDAVLNAYHFGLGWKKLGYKKPYEPDESVSQEPESSGTKDDDKAFTMMGFMNNIKTAMMGGQKEEEVPKIENINLYDDQEEGVWNSSESPMNVMLDHKSDLKNPRAILQKMPRTLYDLMAFGGYEKEVLAELYKKYRNQKGSRFDTREIDLVLNELHIKQKNGIWILSFVDNFDKPLQYERSICQNDFQFSPLALTFEPGVRYPVSHLKIAGNSQRKIDDVATLFFETIARSRNLLFIDENSLADGQLEAIKQNRTGGIIITKKPPVGSFQHAQSPSVSNDLPLMLQMLQKTLIEVTGGDEQLVQGKSANDTLGQDELARLGTKRRESGMQDRVRDWMINQFDKEAYLIQKYDDAQKKLEIVGEDYADPIMAEEAKKKQVEFMTMQNPLGIRRYLPGKYQFDMNIEDAIQPNKAVQRKQYESLIMSSANPAVQQALLQNNKLLRIDSIFEQWLRAHDGIGNPMRFLQQLDSMQKAALQVQQVLMQNGGQVPQSNTQNANSPRENTSQDVSNPSAKPEEAVA